MSQISGRRSVAGAALVAVAAAAGAADAVYLYVTPLTGVSGTMGALIVLGGAVCVAIGAILMMVTGGALWRWLVVLGILGTGLAAYFLHGWWILAAMVVALVGIVIDGIGRAPQSKGAGV